MTIQINPTKVPIWTSEAELRLGAGPDSQVLTQLTHAQERLIHLLFSPVPEAQLEIVGESVGLEAVETSNLVRLLRPSLLESSKAGEQVNLDLRFAEIMRIAFDTNRTPEVVLTGRSKSVLLIEELGRTGLLLIRSLSEMGFRNFVTTDYGQVTRSDCGELGYGKESLGISRLTAARDILGDFGQLEHLKPKKSVTLRVMNSNHSITPSRYREVLEPHIVIEYGIETLQVSSVVQVGKTPCLECRDLWRTEQDSQWCITSIQLALRRDQLDDAATLLFATSLTAKNICGFIDAEDAGNSFEVDLKRRSFRETSFQQHPGCSCRRLESQDL